MSEHSRWSTLGSTASEWACWKNITKTKQISPQEEMVQYTTTFLICLLHQSSPERCRDDVWAESLLLGCSCVKVKLRRKSGTNSVHILPKNVWKLFSFTLPPVLLSTGTSSHREEHWTVWVLSVFTLPFELHFKNIPEGEWRWNVLFMHVKDKYWNIQERNCEYIWLQTSSRQMYQNLCSSSVALRAELQ